MSKTGAEVKQRTVNESRYLRYDFTDAELLATGKQLGEATNKKARIEEELQQVKSQFKFKIDEQDATIGKLTSAVTTGYEMRNVPCTVTLNKPKNGKKTIVRDDNGKEVAVENMTQDEMQETLDLETAKPKGTPVLSEADGEKAKEYILKEGKK